MGAGASKLLQHGSSISSFNRTEASVQGHDYRTLRATLGWHDLPFFCEDEF